MEYPSLKHVEDASLSQLVDWYHWLPEPGLSHVGSPFFGIFFKNEVDIHDRVINRMRELRR